MHQHVVYTGACLVVVKGNKCGQLFFPLTTPTQGYTNERKRTYHSENFWFVLSMPCSGERKQVFGVSVAAYQHRRLPIGSRTQLCWLLFG